MLLEHLGSERTLLALAIAGTALAAAAALPGRPVGREPFAAVALAAVALVAFPAPGQLIRAIHLADSPSVELVSHEGG